MSLVEREYATQHPRQDTDRPNLSVLSKKIQNLGCTMWTNRLCRLQTQIRASARVMDWIPHPLPKTPGLFVCGPPNE